MPLFLIRETTIPGPISCGAPDVIREIEVDAPNMRAAAKAVMDRPPGRLPEGMRYRPMSPGSSTAGHGKPSAKHYAGVADIVAGNPKTLPPAPVRPGPPQTLLDAAHAAVKHTTEALRIDDEGDFGIALYHHLDILADVAEAGRIDFATALRTVAADYAIAPDGRAPQIPEGDFKSGRAITAEIALASGVEAIAIHARLAKLDVEGSLDIALYHLLHSLIALASVRGVDFTAALKEVQRDRRL